jgi:hypothetical protein
MARTKIHSNTKAGHDLRKRIPSSDYYASGRSRVHYPRFETTVGEQVVRLGKQDAWFDPEIGRDLRNARRQRDVPFHHRREFHNAWWGVYDAITIYQGALRQVSGRGMPRTARVSLLFHDYLWDEQALEGRDVEIVLQDENGVELAAALASASRAEQFQRMVGGKPGIMDRLLVRADVLYNQGPKTLDDPYVDYMREVLAPENVHQFFAEAASLDNRGANL